MILSNQKYINNIIFKYSNDLILKEILQICHILYIITVLKPKIKIHLVGQLVEFGESFGIRPTELLNL